MPKRKSEKPIHNKEEKSNKFDHGALLGKCDMVKIGAID